MDSMFYVGIAIAIGITVGLVMSLVYKSTLKGQKATVDVDKDKVIEIAQKEAEHIKKEASLEAKDIVYQAKSEA